MVTGEPVVASNVEPWTWETLAKLVDVGRAGGGVGVAVGATVAIGGTVADEPDRITIIPLVSLVSKKPVKVAVMMSVVNVPDKCSLVDELAGYSSAEKLAPETVPLKSISPPFTGGTPFIPHSS